jgi:hypothetical protein
MLNLSFKRRIGMRKRHAVVLALSLVAGLALPLAAAARPVTVLGSIAISGVDATLVEFVLTNTQITGFAVIANPGLEKTIVQQLPPYTLPVFIDGDGPDGSPSLRLLRRNLDTTVVLTNTTAAPLTIRVKIWRAAGTVPPLAETDLTFGPHETKTFQVSDLLP